jgi:anti-anti-sigma factor
LEVTVGQVQTNTSQTPEPTLVVRATGAIDQATTDQRRTLVQTIMRERTRRLVVDLDDVTTMDPQTIGVLRAAAATAEDMNHAIVFHTSGSPMAEQLRRRHSGRPRRKLNRPPHQRSELAD